MVHIGQTDITHYTPCNYVCSRLECSYEFRYNDPMMAVTRHTLPGSSNSNTCVIDIATLDFYLRLRRSTPSATVAAYPTALSKRPEIDRKHARHFDHALTVLEFVNVQVSAMLAIPRSWCGCCSGAISLKGHPDARMGPGHCDVQNQGHFANQGRKLRCHANYRSHDLSGAIMFRKKPSAPLVNSVCS
eukprot:TRINITY_DN12641_c0_g1_i5.p1 TRINITY_DN12641_c0_g1~~TRINITY_DN12641_c0_g1_i5.p1  ORF type:complete len:188 (+),score=16.34 TRINITY_DN12641_c0_g1_i5:799-1362(+)